MGHLGSRRRTEPRSRQTLSTTRSPWPQVTGAGLGQGSGGVLCPVGSWLHTPSAWYDLSLSLSEPGAPSLEARCPPRAIGRRRATCELGTPGVSSVARVSGKP